MKGMKAGMAFVVASLGVAALGVTPVARAGGVVEPIPVLWRAPSCDVEKLGTVAIEEGRRVEEGTLETSIPAASYPRAFEQLARQAGEKGGNAVVLRGHKATYFTRSHKRSREPVHIELRGAVIRLPAGADACTLSRVDPQVVRRRARSGEPIDVVSDEAY